MPQPLSVGLDDADEISDSTPEPAPALSAVFAVAIAAVATIVLGLLPDIGGGVLTEAAEALSAFR